MSTVFLKHKHSDTTYRYSQSDGPVILGRAYRDGRESEAEAVGKFRHDGCDVMSRSHARLHWMTGVPHITDLGSTHGTYTVDSNTSTETPLIPEQPYPLSSGQIIKFGRRIQSSGAANSYIDPIQLQVQLEPESGRFGMKWLQQEDDDIENKDKEEGEGEEERPEEESTRLIPSYVSPVVANLEDIADRNPLSTVVPIHRQWVSDDHDNSEGSQSQSLEDFRVYTRRIITMLGEPDPELSVQTSDFDVSHHRLHSYFLDQFSSQQPFIDRVDGENKQHQIDLTAEMSEEDMDCSSPEPEESQHRFRLPGQRARIDLEEMENAERTEEESLIDAKINQPLVIDELEETVASPVPVRLMDPIEILSPEPVEESVTHRTCQGFRSQNAEDVLVEEYFSDSEDDDIEEARPKKAPASMKEDSETTSKQIGCGRDTQFETPEQVSQLATPPATVLRSALSFLHMDERMQEDKGQEKNTGEDEVTQALLASDRETDELDSMKKVNDNEEADQLMEPDDDVSEASPEQEAFPGEHANVVSPEIKNAFTEMETDSSIQIPEVEVIMATLNADMDLDVGIDIGVEAMRQQEEDLQTDNTDVEEVAEEPISASNPERPDVKSEYHRKLSTWFRHDDQQGATKLISSTYLENQCVAQVDEEHSVSAITKSVGISDRLKDEVERATHSESTESSHSLPSPNLKRKHIEIEVEEVEEECEECEAGLVVRRAEKDQVELTTNYEIPNTNNERPAKRGRWSKAVELTTAGMVGAIVGAGSMLATLVWMGTDEM